MFKPKTAIPGRLGYSSKEGIRPSALNVECPIHILVEDGGGAREILEANWMDIIAEKDALVREIPDHPGALEEITRKLADAGVNIEVAYFTTQAKIALVVDDLDKAQAELQGALRF